MFIELINSIFHSKNFIFINKLLLNIYQKDMEKLFENFKNNYALNEENALLFFENGEEIKVNANGKCGIFAGYLTFVEGEFTINDLQNFNNEMQIFATDCVNIEINNSTINKHITIIAESFSNFNQQTNNNITIVKNLSPEKISYLINGNDDLTKLNYKKCVLYFPEDIKNINNQDLNTIKDKLKNMKENFYEVDLTKKYSDFLPYFDEKDAINIANRHYIKQYKKFKKKNIAIINFGISNNLKNILNKYFNIIYVPASETAKHIKYLYYDNKIDGVILSDFNYDTCFINQNIKKEVYSIIDSNIPILGIEAGAILMAELLGSETKITNNILQISNFNFEDIGHKHYQQTSFYFKKINILSTKLRSKFYDEKITIVGFESKEKKAIGYCFNLINNDKLTFFLEKFYKKMKNDK